MLCSHKNKSPSRLLGLISLLVLCCVSRLVVAESLPRPPGLEPEIGFWRQVFSEVSSRQGVIHDNRHLGVVYGTVTLPDRAGSSERRRLFKQAIDDHRSILKSLAKGKRTSLSPEQARVLALWPEGVSDKELRLAATRVRVQQGLSDRFEQGLVRSGQWTAHIHQQLEEQGVPAELAALPHVESSFNPKAYSHIGAAGLWQFTRQTGKLFMQVDHVVDSRRDPFLSSDAAARLLRSNYEALGSWPLAITAYNHGVGGMRRAIKQLGTDDIEQIIRHYHGRAFGFASRNFYVALLAAEEVQRTQRTYFGTVRPALPRNDMVLVLPQFVPVAALENAFGVSRSTLQAYNPALMSPVWNGKKRVPRGYALRLPADMLATTTELVWAQVPSDYRFSEQSPDLYHKVRKGETLSRIARTYQTSVGELVAWNGLRSRNQIRIGQTLKLPQPDNVPTEKMAVAKPEQLASTREVADLSDNAAELFEYSLYD